MSATPNNSFLASRLNYEDQDIVRWIMGMVRLRLWNPGPEVIKLFFMLSSGETKIYPAHKC